MIARQPGTYAQLVPQIEAMLLGRLGLLVRELAPGGQVRGHEYVALNPVRHDHKLGSFSINLASGKWADWAAGEASARTFPCLSLVAYLATDGRWKSEGEHRPGAVRWARDWLGLTDRNASPAERTRMAEHWEKVAKDREREDKQRAEKRRQAAYAMWMDAKPVEEGDPVWTYLAGRGIDLAAFPKVPETLRYAVECRYYTEGGNYDVCPAMLAGMHLEGVPSGFAAVHRTYLRERKEVEELSGGKFHIKHLGYEKAYGRFSKKILGAKSGGTIRLTRGASGLPLSRAPEGEWVAVAEGIENALSAALVRPDLRVLAAGTLENIGKIVLPEQIGGIFIIADNDKPSPDPKKPGAYEVLSNVCDQLCERGFDLQIVRAPAGFKDFNDALTGKRQDTPSPDSSTS